MFRKTMTMLLLTAVITGNILLPNETAAQAGNLANDQNVTVTASKAAAGDSKFLFDGDSAPASGSNTFQFGEADGKCWMELEFAEMLQFNHIVITQYAQDPKIKTFLLEACDTEETVDENGEAVELNYFTLLEGTADGSGLITCHSESVINAKRVRLTVQSYQNGKSGNVALSEFWIGSNGSDPADPTPTQKPQEPDTPQETAPVIGNNSKLLDAMGVMPISDSSAFDGNAAVTRGAFAGILTRLVKANADWADFSVKLRDVKETTPNYKEIQYVFSMGYMTPKSPGKFQPDAPITTEEAACALLKVLGYGYMAADDSRLLGTSGASALLSGVSSLSSALNQNTCAKLLVNALDVPLVEYNFSDGSASVKNGETLLKNVWHMASSVNTVTATHVLSLSGDAGEVGAGVVRMGSTDFNCGAYDMTPYVGYRIKIYYEYTKDMDRPLLTWFESKAQKTVTVSGEDVVSVSRHEIVIQTENEAKDQKFKIPSGAVILYNNRRLVSYTEDVFRPENGQITFVSNDGDGYDLIVIREGIDVMISGGTEEKLLFDNEENMSGLDISDPDSYRITKNGTDITPFEIQQSDVLTIFPNYIKKVDNQTLIGDEADYFEILVSTQSVSGTIDSLEEDKLSIGGSSIEMTEKYRRKYTHKIGQSGTFHLNIYGKIASSTLTARATDSIGYVYAFHCESSEIDPSVSLKIYTQKGHLVLRLADKVSLNGDSRKTAGEALFEGTLFQPDSTGTLAFKPQLIQYSTDSDGNVYKLDTAVPRAENQDKTAGLELSAEKLGRTFLRNGYTFNNDFLVTTNPVIFNVPLDASETDEGLFRIMRVTELATNGNYIVEAFNASDTLLSSLLVIYHNDTSTTPDVKANTVVISKISEKLDKDGGTATYIDFYERGMQDSLPVAPERLNAFKALEPGMVIQYHKNFKGELDGFNLVFDYKDPQSTSLNNSYWALQGVFGTVTKKQGDTFLLATPLPGGGELTKPYQFRGTLTQVYEFNCKTGKLIQSDTSAIPVMDDSCMVFIRFYFAQSREVVIYKNYQ
ncbi:S-layer homology domain-containing protein [Acetivibrio sp. MSJd-27]|uniref:S-layer homology domain-containing protein n=1 Tax=Acetivibrio sp. MSJd-27 TaxID=2841523 RepID=UPI001C11E936|nr:S-layer homology domain-containing protein [Acetivibrio sp. MSJd-27]MBU5449378.1 S-layer homology domain-containing protein [Acetivibrio sp. MSJd-27]